MNEITLLRASGPEAPPLRPQARSAARAALLAEIEGTPAGRRARRPGRRTTLQIGAGLLAVAAAWTTAVVVAPDGPGTPADGVTLVHFDTPTFPLSLDPVPDGLTPAFDGDGDGSWIAAYDDAAEENGFTVYVGDHAVAPDEGAPGSRSHGASEVSVGDTEAELVRYSRDWCTGDAGVDCGRRSFTRLSWERADDQWVTLLAYGRYRTPERIVAIAESLVDRPQPATLQVGLAPAGWSVQFFTMGRVLTLADDADEQQTVTVHVPLPEDVSPPDQLRGQLMGPVGPLMTVTVQGRPAYLVRIDAGGRDTGWYLQAQFADGTTFVVQAPEAFTQEQVIAFADQVMHNS